MNVEITAAQYAVLAGVHRSTVYRRLAKAWIPGARRIGRFWIITLTPDVVRKHLAQAVADYREQSTLLMPAPVALGGDPDKVAAFKAAMAALGAKHERALAVLRILGRTDVVEALVESRAATPGNAGRHRREVAERTIEAALRPAIEVEPTTARRDPVAWFDEMGADFDRHDPRRVRRAA